MSFNLRDVVNSDGSVDARVLRQMQEDLAAVMGNVGFANGYGYASRYGGANIPDEREKAYCLLRNGAGETLASGTVGASILDWAVDFDTHGMYTSTDTITIPFDGLWQIRFSGRLGNITDGPARSLGFAIIDQVSVETFSVCSVQLDSDNLSGFSDSVTYTNRIYAGSTFSARYFYTAPNHASINVDFLADQNEFSAKLLSGL